MGTSLPPAIMNTSTLLLFAAVAFFATIANGEVVNIVTNGLGGGELLPKEGRNNWKKTTVPFTSTAKDTGMVLSCDVICYEHCSNGICKIIFCESENTCASPL